MHNIEGGIRGNLVKDNVLISETHIVLSFCRITPDKENRPHLQKCEI